MASIMLKQSTVATILIGPFLDSIDGITPETGLTISQADVLLSKNGAALAQKTEASASSHDAGGWYACDLDATDTGTLGILKMSIQESGAIPVWHTFQIVTADYWDMVFANGLSDITDDILAGTIEGSESVIEVLRYLLAFVGGETNGGGSTPVNFRDQADSLNRIAMTVDSNGNRSSTTLNGA